jgi:N-acetylglucosamine kinase
LKDDVYQGAVMYYGFDIGGTKIALGVFDKQRRLQWETRVPTPRDSYDAFLDAVCNLVTEADLRFGVKGSVGIGIPGMPETEDGTLYAANVPAASGKPLRADLSARLDRDVRLDNDANCFALSEAWDDEFTQYPLVMGLILGTGVGGGLVLNGKSITGRSYITGEFGHIRLPVDALTLMGFDFPLRRCGCGQLGCIESYLSGGGFAWLYQHYYHQSLDAREIIALWEQGDEQARAHVERYLDLLAVCLGNILTIVDPDLVVIGGGLSNFTAITTQLADRLPRHLLPVARVPRIEQARHGDAGGMRGAAFLHLTD